MDTSLTDLLSDCTLCPRNCHVNRLEGNIGYCGETGEIVAARAALHFWEEPCLSGTNGSGAVFFCGCNLKCDFCQNRDISVGKAGRVISPERLAEIFLELQEKKAHNINLVTPSHFVPQIIQAIQSAKDQGLLIPIVYNTGSYEKPETLKMLEGLIDIYLPDLKFYSPELSARFSHAEDYFEIATAAIAEMFRQVGPPVLTSPSDLSGAQISADCADAPPLLMQRGMIVRHLVLPGQTKDSKKILRYLNETYYDDIYVSIMNQYTPLPHVADIPELNRPVSDKEYARILLFAKRIGIVNGFHQEGGTAAESFIPLFDGEGL